MSSAGDVNGDGYDDLIIGATDADGDNNDEGKAYIIFGQQNPLNVDLSDSDTFEGFVISGVDASDRLGTSVSSAGDVNGDGYADLIVGARDADGDVAYSGAAYVIFGGATAVDVDLSALSAAQGFIIPGIAAGDQAGYSVSLGR